MSTFLISHRQIEEPGEMFMSEKESLDWIKAGVRKSIHIV